MSTIGIVKQMKMEAGTTVVGRARDVDTVRTTSKLERLLDGRHLEGSLDAVNIFNAFKTFMLSLW